MSEEEAYEFVKNTLREEGIVPYHGQELEVVRSVEQCMNCGLCLNHCPVVRAVGVDRFSGPRGIAVELSRSPPEYWSTADTIYLCTGCGTCREVCPKNVDIPSVVILMRARIFKRRSDLVPKSLLQLSETLTKYGLAFTPWEDEEDKAESRDARLERHGLPHIEDRIKPGAEVLYYPGCQAEERSQEIREAAKLILDYFGIDFTLPTEMSCCGLPAKLIGDEETARSLASRLTEQVRSLKVRAVVTTCAGCTSRILEIAEEENWGVPVYHMVEFLAERVGIDRLGAEFSKGASEGGITVTVHDPCHLIRHVSRLVMDSALEILGAIPDVELADSGVADSCCGGGGLVGYHAADVSSLVTARNIEAITRRDPDRVVAPCPLCTSQIENELYRHGSGIEVDDLTVFIAKHLPLRR
ncbi:MAG: (Fe-S)-binding protein [Candidatus Thorarchaeota archaeon]